MRSVLTTESDNAWGQILKFPDFVCYPESAKYSLGI